MKGAARMATTPHDPVTGEIKTEDDLAREEDAGTRPRSFAVLLPELEHGAVNQQLTTTQTRLLCDMAAIAHDFPGLKKIKGKITLELDYVLDDGTVHIMTDVKVKSPLPPRGATGYWITKEGGLAKSDPRQLKMFAEIK